MSAETFGDSTPKNTAKGKNLVPVKKSLPDTSGDEAAFKKWKSANARFTFKPSKLCWRAAQDGNVEVTRYLLSSGYCDNLLWNKSLHLKNLEGCLTLIKAGINLNKQFGDRNATVLYRCLYSDVGNIELAKALIAAGADTQIRANNKSLHLPVDLALRNGFREIAGILGHIPPEKPTEYNGFKTGWEFTEQEGHQMAIRTTRTSESKTVIREIFNFSAEEKVTEVKGPGQSPSIAITKFSDVASGLIDEAKQKLADHLDQTIQKSDVKLV